MAGGETVKRGRVRDITTKVVKCEYCGKEVKVRSGWKRVDGGKRVRFKQYSGKGVCREVSRD